MMCRLRRKNRHFLSKRILPVVLFMALQAAILILGIWYVSDYAVYWHIFFTALSLLAVVYIVNQKKNPSYKLAWVIAILVFPVFGGLLYILYGVQGIPRRFQKELQAAADRTLPLLQQDQEVMRELYARNRDAYVQATYILHDAGYPVYRNTSVSFLSPGEKKYERLKAELRRAEHYIFLEYFIIEEGVMWDGILHILRDKVKKGVKVRLLYDGVGCLTTLPAYYWKTMQEQGIECREFNPFVPVLSTILNNRDHRKIAVIDGHTAFTGGINLADEYINRVEPFGHCKDASVVLLGEAVWSFTLMFLQMWNLGRETEEHYERYLPQKYHPQPFENDGFVQPYSDSPLDQVAVGENVYLNLIAKAKEYLYIQTPYFIVDNEMMTALTLAAKSGVDVRIMTPHHPDKWYVHMLTRAYYKDLIRDGVKVYEYTPGFLHSKTVVADDVFATVGTINFDYRSLYLHFECGTWLFGGKAVMQVKQDFLNTLSECTQISLKDCQAIKWYKRLLSGLLRLLAPLL